MPDSISPASWTVSPNASIAERLASLPKAERDRVLTGITPEALEQLRWDWPFWARKNQLPPDGPWRVWLLLSGRGFGKTRVGAEFVRARAKLPNQRIALVAPTSADVRDVMVEGESGVLSVCPPDERPLYEPTKRRLTWFNGSIATTYSADEPDRLRGPQSTAAWCDEVASWSYPEAFDMLMLGLRIGSDPRCVITTTPRPTKTIKDLVADPRVVVTRGSSYENRANLSPAFFEQIIRKYEGTRLGRQELEAEILEDTPGALWTRGILDATRVARAPDDLVSVVVGIDPAATSGEEADETGIIVVGKDRDGHGYVLADASGRYIPSEWARTAIAAYKAHRADRLVAERNNGGEMVVHTLHSIDQNVPVATVWASRGKAIRAEPVSALYEQGRVHHVGTFAALEDQQCSFTVDFDKDAMGYSPDRLDALVWAITELLVEQTPMLWTPTDLVRVSWPAA